MKKTVVQGASNDYSIEIDSLSKTFFTRQGKVPAIENFSLRINTGEFLSIVGPSGCGKSTLLRIVAGLLDFSGGQVMVGGKNVVEPITNVGIVFQRDLLMEWRTTLDNVLLQIEMRGLKTDDYRDRAMELLRKVGLSEFAHKYPRELSGGMRQRAAICRALIHDPPILLMDEPFGALDALTRDEIAADLAWLCADSNKTVLFITHSIAEAVFLSDRVVVMSARPARIVEDIKIDLPHPRTIEVGESSSAAADYQLRIRHHLYDREAHARRAVSAQ